ESEDAQERRGQGGLVLLRKPGVAELLHGHLRLNRDGRMISTDVLWGDLVPADWRSLNGFCHRICLTEKRILMPCLCSRPFPALPHFRLHTGGAPDVLTARCKPRVTRAKRAALTPSRPMRITLCGSPTQGAQSPPGCVPSLACTGRGRL